MAGRNHRGNPARSAGGERKRRQFRVGGWGFAVSTTRGAAPGSAAKPCAACLWAHDGRVPWTRACSMSCSYHFRREPHHCIVRWTTRASTRRLRLFRAPLVVSHASIPGRRRDRASCDWPPAISMPCASTSPLGRRAPRSPLVGGLADPMARWVSSDTRVHLIQTGGAYALDGAIALARVASREAKAYDLQTTDVHDARG